MKAQIIAAINKHVVRKEQVLGHEVLVVLCPIPDAMMFTNDTHEIIVMTSALWNMGADVRRAVLLHEIGHRPDVRKALDAINLVLYQNAILSSDKPEVVFTKAVSIFKGIRKANKRSVAKELNADLFAVQRGEAEGLRKLLSSKRVKVAMWLSGTSKERTVRLNELNR